MRAFVSVAVALLLCVSVQVRANSRRRGMRVNSGGATSSFTPTATTDGQCVVTGPRYNCGYVGSTQETCEQSGCCWSPLKASGVPWCFYKTDVAHGYRVVESSVPTYSSKTGEDLMLALELLNGQQFFGVDADTLNVGVTYVTNRTLRVRITDPAEPGRWEVPESLVPTGGATSGSASELSKLEYEFSYTERPFGFAVTRRTDGVTVFNTSSDGTFNGIVWEDQYLEVTTRVPSGANTLLAGFGEHVQNMTLAANDFYTIWNIDNPTPEHQNLYGSHPFYLQLSNGLASGAFLRSSNGMDVQIGPNGDTITYHVIGGVLDFFIFVGDTPQEVLHEYHSLIGLPHLPPYWSLGWHQCRYGYSNLDEVIDVVANYSKAKIPLDNVWMDIDYMDGWKDFTYDPVNFPQVDVAAFVDALHENGQQFVPIVDPGIHVSDDYASYTTGLEMDVYIKTYTGDNFVGKVWPGYTTFPDFFFHPNASNYWQSQLEAFHDLAAFDGIWIDMNEVSNFCAGYCDGSSTSAGRRASSSTDVDSPTSPPYAINNLDSQAALNTKTFDMDAVQYPSHQVYDTHNLYGLTESVATREALENMFDERAFVLTRSTFASSGHHVAHWLGDNWSTYESMQASLPGAMLMNLYGVPLVGADICGFIGDTTEELCARWQSMGVFFPFTRNHNTLGAADQFPYLWPVVANATRTCLAARYALLPYYYTVFWRVSSVGGSVMRPLWYNYAHDLNTYAIEDQFMIGDSLMIAPALVEGATTVDCYFPDDDIWYDWWTKSYVEVGPALSLELEAPLDRTQVFVRGGSVLATQAPEMTLNATSRNPFRFICAVDARGLAKGHLYWDDLRSLKQKQTLLVDIEASLPRVTFTPSGQLDAAPSLEAVEIWADYESWMTDFGQTLTIDGEPLSNFGGAYVNTTSGETLTYGSQTYAKNVWVVEGLALDLNEPHTFEWSASS